MTPFKRIRTPMHRYGDPDFDREYVRWGLHDPEEQRRQADSLLALLPSPAGLRILDLACGIGTHAIVWAKAGHDVVGVDLSETFIAKAGEAARAERIDAVFIVSDVRDISYESEFDVIAWIERSFFDEEVARAVWHSLRPGGRFILDDRNPENPKVQARQANWRTWREADGKFHLERHETDPETGLHQDAWITIDPEAELIEEKVGTTRHQTMHDRIGILEQVGFRQVELKTMAGETFTGGAEPSWLWVVAEK